MGHLVRESYLLVAEHISALQCSRSGANSDRLGKDPLFAAAFDGLDEADQRDLPEIQEAIKHHICARAILNVDAPIVVPWTC